jgi:hypothetical protein
MRMHLKGSKLGAKKKRSSDVKKKRRENNEKPNGSWKKRLLEKQKRKPKPQWNRSSDSIQQRTKKRSTFVAKSKSSQGY